MIEGKTDITIHEEGVRIKLDLDFRMQRAKAVSALMYHFNDDQIKQFDQDILELMLSLFLAGRSAPEHGYLEKACTSKSQRLAEKAKSLKEEQENE